MRFNTITKAKHNSALNDFLYFFLDTLFSSHCFICGKVFTNELNGVICLRCMHSLLKKQHLIENALKPFEKVYSSFAYKDAESIIHIMKFSHRRRAAILLGEILGRRIYDKKLSYDIIIPVPLGKKRFKERGYNQSLVIANSLSKYIDAKVDSSVVYRNRETQALSTLGAEENRGKEIRGAFSIRTQGKIHNKNILLVDDVFTTGSTLKEIGNLLLENKAQSVSVVTAAKA